MPPAAALVTLTAAERKTLKKRVRGAKTCWRDRIRAQVVLAAARGRGTARIATDLRITDDTVRKWRGRFTERGLGGARGPPCFVAPISSPPIPQGCARFPSQLPAPAIIPTIPLAHPS